MSRFPNGQSLYYRLYNKIGHQCVPSTSVLISVSAQVAGPIAAESANKSVASLCNPGTDFCYSSVSFGFFVSHFPGKMLLFDENRNKFSQYLCISGPKILQGHNSIFLEIRHYWVLVECTQLIIYLIHSAS